jgi:transcriptional regulator with XRE-family HTH domain
MTEDIDPPLYEPQSYRGIGYPKITPEQHEELLERYKAGAVQKELADAYGVTIQTIAKYLRRAKVLRPTSIEVKEKRLAEISDIPATIVLTSDTPNCTPPPPPPKISCLDIEQTFHENLSWAIQSAGLLLRTKRKPTECPNDTAFFLYQQACEDPKGFLGRFALIQGRLGDDKEDAELQKEGQRSVAEIEEQLQALNEVEEPIQVPIQVLDEVKESDPQRELFENEFFYEEEETE